VVPPTSSLSDHERRRFELIAGELAQDSSLSRLDARSRAKPRRTETHGRRRRRGLVAWAAQRFADRMRRDRGR